MSASAQYYAGIEHDFLALCPRASGHMNMGLWPAGSLCAAQERLIRAVLDHAARRRPGLRAVLDAGCGWGGARNLFREILPAASYIGVNVSPVQVASARQRTAGMPATRYLQMPVAQAAGLLRRGELRADALVAIESAFHFDDKAALWCALRADLELLVLAGISVAPAAAPLVAAHPRLRAALGQGWSLEQYRDGLHRAGFCHLEVTDWTPLTFDGFSAHLSSLTPSNYRGRPAILRQLRQAFAALAKLAARRQLQYLLLSVVRGALPAGSARS
jgi:hypothetical protein